MRPEAPRPRQGAAEPSGRRSVEPVRGCPPVHSCPLGPHRVPSAPRHAPTKERNPHFHPTSTALRVSSASCPLHSPQPNSPTILCCHPSRGGSHSPAPWWICLCPAEQGGVPNSLPLAYLWLYVYLKCNTNSPQDQSPVPAGLYGQSRELDCWQQRK